MNNEETPQNTQYDNVVPPPSPVPIPAPVESPAPMLPPKQPRNWLKISLAVAAGIIVILLIAGAYYLGTMSPNHTAANAETSSQTTTNTTAEELPDEESTPIADPYAGWNTYENAVYGYSFKHPSDWKVDREVVQEPADWVKINPPSGASSDGDDALAIYTYFDGTGCPVTKTKEFTVGGYSVEGTACVEDEVYKIGMKHSKTVGMDGHGVVLARAASNAVGIQIDMSRGEDEIVQQILDSITGLTP